MREDLGGPGHQRRDEHEGSRHGEREPVGVQARVQDHFREQREREHGERRLERIPRSRVGVPAGTEVGDDRSDGYEHKKKGQRTSGVLNPSVDRNEPRGGRHAREDDDDGGRGPSARAPEEDCRRDTGREEDGVPPCRDRELAQVSRHVLGAEPPAVLWQRAELGA